MLCQHFSLRGVQLRVGPMAVLDVLLDWATMSEQSSHQIFLELLVRGSK